MIIINEIMKKSAEKHPKVKIKERERMQVDDRTNKR